MGYNTTEASNGVSVSGGNTIVIANPGIYNLQFSMQLKLTTGSAAELVRIWYRKNGIDAPRSSTEVTIRTAAEPEVAAWNFVDTFSAGDTF